MRNNQINLRLEELDPVALAALIDCLEAKPTTRASDQRIPKLRAMLERLVGAPIRSRLDEACEPELNP